ncbi:hypothetical protein N2152v2_009969 [Parachlorella kessleri]
MSPQSAVAAAAASQPGSSSSSPAQPCPLHACLLRHGITDLAAFSAPKHLAHSQEAVDSNVEPKLAALAAEGLKPKQVWQVLKAHNSPLWCSYADTFLPNLQLLREIGAYTDHMPHPGAPHLTAAGKALANNPHAAAMYLSRDPGKQHLGLDAAAALQVVIAQPKLLTFRLEFNLPPLLRFLDEYMGEEGAGRRLVRAQPSIGAETAAAAAKRIDSLAARGNSQQRIQGLPGKQPQLLAVNFDSPLQRQKMDWIQRVSPWALDDFLDVPRYFTSTKTRRLAARLAFLQECGLPPPPTPGVLAVRTDSHFMNSAQCQVARQGRELPWATWAEWEEAWLGTEEGREWGFPPLKE